MEWILNLVGQGHPHAACLALAAKLFFILLGGVKKKGVRRCSNCQLQWKARLKTLSLNPWTRKRRGVGSERQGEGTGGKEERGGRWWYGGVEVTVVVVVVVMGVVSSLQSDLFAKSGHNESIMSPLIRESVWGPTNWAWLSCSLGAGRKGNLVGGCHAIIS